MKLEWNKFVVSFAQCYGNNTNILVERIKETRDFFLSLFFSDFIQGGERGAVLTLTLNDMGNYGCYPDCAEGMSMPLYAEAIVNLMRKQPMSSFLAHSKLQIS